MDKEPALPEIGLNENERKVYLELLKLGPSKVNELSKRLNLPRTTVYTLLDSLIRKGLSSYIIQSGIKIFEASDPKKLLSILEEKREALNKILPDLEAMKRSITEKPQIEVYEGKEGLKTLFDDILISKPKEHLMIASFEIFEVLDYYFPNFIKRKEKLGIRTRVIGPINEKAKPYIKAYKSKIKKREIGALPKTFIFQSRIDLYNDKVIITNLKKENLVSILIKDKTISISFKSIFEQLWKIAKL